MAITAGSPQTATILVTDLVGSTELRVQVGEERAEVLRRLHDRLIAAEINARNGTVVKGLGDGALAMFNGAADAVAAAVAIQQSLALHNRRTREAPLAVRIGISAGDVTIEEGDCFGTPVVEASRLCAHATGGRILVAELIRLLARGRGDHEFNAIGDVELKGLPEPVAVAEVLWDAHAASIVPLPAALAVTSWYPFAGRSREVETLALRWKEAAAEGLRFVALSGEPGMGKTRMSTELARRVHGEGATVLYGRCDEELDTPYRPFVEALRHLVSHASDAVLSAHVAAVGAVLSTVVPELCRRIDCDAAGEAGDSDRTRLFQAVLDLLSRAAEEAPVLLVLDDLHWADRSSLLLLRHLIVEGGELPTLVVGTYRDTDLARTHPLAAALADLRRNPVVERVALEGLGVDDVASFLTAAAGTGEVDAPGVARLAELLFAETEGNPFFLSEVLSHLMESRAIYQENGRWVGDRALIARLGVPEGVREVLGRRLSALSDAANEALTVAAVIGQEFSVPVLAEVLGVDSDTLVERLDEAVDRRLIGEAPQSFDTFRFAHALVRQTLSEELTTSRRVRLHRKIGVALEGSGGTVEQLAHHFGEAAVMGEEDRALGYAKAAGDAAVAGFAFEQAAAWYRRALEMDEALDADLARRCELLLALGTAVNLSGEVSAARPVFVEALELAERGRLPDHAARAAIAYGGAAGVWVDSTDTTALRLIDSALAIQPDSDEATKARLLLRRSHWLMITPGAAPERKRIIGEAVALSRSSGDPTLRAEALSAMAEALRGVDAAKQLEVGDEMVALAEATASPELLAQGSLIRAAGLMRANRLDELEECVRLMSEFADSSRSKIWRWTAASIGANVAIIRGDFDRAEELIIAERGHAQPLAETALIIAWVHEILIGQKVGDTARVAAAYAEELKTPLMSKMWLDAPVALLRGDVDAAASSIYEWMERLNADAVADEFRVNLVAHLARFSLACGLTDCCERLYDEILPLAGSWLTNAPMIVADHADLLLGRLAAFLGRGDDAIRHLRAALAAFEASRAQPYLASAAAELAAVVEDREEAAVLLARADAIADELRLTPVHERVDEVAAQLTLSRPPDPVAT